jgi:hypothetical protein
LLLLQRGKAMVVPLRVSFQYIYESIGRIGGPAAVAELKAELSNDDIKR